MSNQKKYRIIFGDDDIKIESTKGEELLYWHQEEWEEDPRVVFSICNAVKLAAEGNDNLRKLCG